MRAIRFRAWDTEKKEMLPPWSIWKTNLFGCDFACDLNLMQSTGLLDKNGKEIYELDKVSVPYINPMGKLCRDTENYKGVIRFIHGSFYVCKNEKEEKSLLSNWCERGETEYISNYGEYAELLDKTVLEIVGNEKEVKDV